MNSEYYMQRMDGHPVPRIEIVHTPRRPAVVGGGSLDMAHPQPWHVRNIGGNGEPTKVSEQLEHYNGCATNIVADAALYGWPAALITRHVAGETLAEGADGTHVWTVILDPEGKTGRRIPVLLRVEP